MPGQVQQFVSLSHLIEILSAYPGLVVDSGEVGARAPVGSNTLDAKMKNWPVDAFKTLIVEVYEGRGAHQARVIANNAPNALVITGTWDKEIAVGARFRIKAPVDLRQALRDVLGGGSNISAANPLEVHDPKVGSLISYEGITTANGASDGSTLVCSGLTTEPDFDGNQLIITSGDYAGQARDISGATTGGTVTPHPALGGQIVSGTTFIIAAIRTVPAEVAALMADVGDASASALGSLYAILGNPSATIASMVDDLEAWLGFEGATALADKLTVARAALLDEITAARMAELDAANLPADIDTLLTRLSAARAGYLDELAAANMPTDIDTLLTRLTAARAGYLDNINNTDLANVIGQVAETTGTFSFDETSAAEQTMVTVTITARATIGGIWLDMVNVTQDTTIRVKHQIDGSNYRTFETNAWATTDGDGVLITGFTAYRNVQISLECGGGGAGSVNVPYAIV